MKGHNNQRKIALINDYSGFGRCSVTAQLPIISMLKVQCCPLPTSIFSNHTAYPEYVYQDYTEYMEEYMKMWKKLDLRFEGICTGFLGSVRQIKIVGSFIREFKSENTVVIIDPVMGDDGVAYPTYTDEMCQNMRELVKYADIVTPNLTEACVLAGREYKEKWKRTELEELAKAVAEIGPAKVVITGIPQKSFVCNLCFENGEATLLKTYKVGASRAGTGDVFSAILAADAVNGVEFVASVQKASRFVKKGILKAMEMNLPIEDGVPFEEFLGELR